MRKFILFLAVIAIAPSALRAKQPPLSSIPIKQVYVYAKMVHPDDAAAMREVSWLRQVVADVFHWQLTSRSQAAAIIIVLPHGAGYQTAGGGSCSSVAGSLTCDSLDGSSLSIMCTENFCNSSSNPGNYLSLIVATPVAGAEKEVRMRWRSDRGAGGLVAHMNIMATDSAKEQNMAFQDSVSSLCHAAGIAGRRKCSSLTWRSWKRWKKSSKTGGEIISLP